MSNYLKRLSLLIYSLKDKEHTSDQLLEVLLEKNFIISQRQLQRDINSLEIILSQDESLQSYFSKGKKYFYIKVLSLSDHPDGHQHSNVICTKFYYQNLDSNKIRTIELVETAIFQHKILKVQLVIDDETGDNVDLDTTKFNICPIKLIYHRSSYYVACFNLKTELVEVFGIRQLINIELSKPFFDVQHLEHLVSEELSKRFGVTKNMNEFIYDIVLEFTSATGRFIEDHFWHSSQKVNKMNGNYIVTMRCGINRELMGWIFQWMYNVKVIEPPFLKELYNKSLQECKTANKIETPFVYRNIFTN